VSSENLLEGVGPPAAAVLALGQEQQLDPRVIPFSRAVGWITAAVLTTGLVIGLVLFQVSVNPVGWVTALVALAVALAIAGLAWSAHFWPAIDYRHSSYRVDGEGLEIRSGVVWRRVLNVPRSRVQHTDVSQGPLERSYGLGTLAVYTAGTDHAQVTLRGLDRVTALAIRDHLLPREGDDAV